MPKQFNPNALDSLDSSEIFELLRNTRTKTKRPAGVFRIINLEKNRVDWSGFNLVVAQGREYVAQKIVTHNLSEPPSGDGRSLTDLPSGVNNLREYELTHYAFGGGGAIVTDPDTYDLTGPDICDYHLAKPITYGIPTYLNDPGNIDEGDDIHKSEYAVKPIHTGDNEYQYITKQYPTDSETQCSYYSQFYFTLYKEEGEFGCLADGENVQVSEAGLYITKDTDAKLFARICFPPKFMEKDGKYGFEWYVIC